MCLFCDRDQGPGDDAAQRVHVLRLLALVEHPDALPKDAALRLGQEIMALMKPGSGVRRCEPVSAPDEPIKQLN
jgi:hypothetical protein